MQSGAFHTHAPPPGLASGQDWVKCPSHSQIRDTQTNPVGGWDDGQVWKLLLEAAEWESKAPGLAGCV